ncbi:MAG TPA: choice-of-anchor Q domain-containing protein, partial [Solirubrobacteraceae bacterium]|nr:choice-of-anchor Q domain-containing protein [Solirubrobacteraceae bacterium]
GGLTLVNSIVAFNGGGSCAINISNGGHDLIFPADAACPFGLHADPRLRDLGSYGGPTPTFALKLGSPARDQVPTNASCPGIDQRGVHRPQGRACDIGAFEFALPRVRIGRPRDGARYKRGKRVLASFSCIEAGLRTLIRSCRGTVPIGHRIDTSTHGRKRFTVVATDRAGNRVSKTVHYRVQKR